MTEFLSELLKAQPDTLLVVGGLLLLLLAVVGDVRGRIRPGKGGRIASGVIGPILIVVGLLMHANHLNSSTPSQTSSSTSNPVDGNKAGKDCSAGVGTCVSGFVWREASSRDRVCVTEVVRQQTRNDNAQAVARRNPSGGAYGSDTCLSGFVWRDAFEGDHVCVTPQARLQAAQDNGLAGERNACP